MQKPFTKEPGPERLFTEKELVEAGYGSRSKLAQDRMRGKGIPFIYQGACVRYRESDVLAWLEANSATHSLQWTSARRSKTPIKLFTTPE
ncbi:MAG: hypothetical protein SFY67_05105 [Candidatus Melainabacteria bacterium]|nr:hypothetical protein [Candidatus Melainabacteria bacterium]